MERIPCMLFRAGTSKGPVFLKSELPSDPIERDRLLLNIMGSPHQRQIDGIGGGDSLSSKVAIVSISDRDDADLSYLFAQVHVKEAVVETTLNCGNMLSAVAPFAIERGLIKTQNPETTVSIYNENTGVIMEATVQTPNGKINYAGDTHIDGVPGSAAPIKLSFINAAGSKTKKLLPTNNVQDEINGIHVTCIDVAVPMVIINATAMGLSGVESKEELDSNKDFLNHLESIRIKAALKMGLGDVSDSRSPKVCIISKPLTGGTISSHYFTPFKCHAAHAVSGALCLAAACLLEGTVANEITKIQLPSNTAIIDKEVVIEHPSGKIWTLIKADCSKECIDFPLASFIRTARPLFDGTVLSK